MTSNRGPGDRLGDVALDDAWHAASTEQPAPQSDAAILDAARAEARTAADASRQRRRTYWQTVWQPLAAAAGVAGLALLLVRQVPTETAAPDAAPAAASRQAAEPVPEESAERASDFAAPAAPPSPAAPPLPAPAARNEAGLAAAKSEADAVGPEDTVRRIVELYESGNLAAAADELRAFRGAHADADARLPGELREWAEAVTVDDAR